MVKTELDALGGQRAAALPARDAWACLPHSRRVTLTATLWPEPEITARRRRHNGCREPLAAEDPQIRERMGEMPPVMTGHLGANELTEQKFGLLALHQGRFLLIQCLIHRACINRCRPADGRERDPRLVQTREAEGHQGRGRNQGWR